MEAWVEQAEEVQGHKLRRDEYGVWTYGGDHHDGPKCELCEESWCWFCTSIEEIKPCDKGASINALRAEWEEKEVLRDAKFLCIVFKLNWDEITESYRNDFIKQARETRAILAEKKE